MVVTLTVNCPLTVLPPLEVNGTVKLPSPVDAVLVTVNMQPLPAVLRTTDENLVLDMPVASPQVMV